MVPVVRGGADYARFFPRGTFVDTGWFDGPLRLTQFLRSLGQDTTTYVKLLWRKEGGCVCVCVCVCVRCTWLCSNPC